MGQGFVVRSNPLGGLDSGGEGRVDEEEDEVNDDEIEDGRRALLRANGEYPTSKDIEALKALTRTTVLDDASEHSSGKDSGTGSGTERSPGAVGESITILDVLGTGDRRSLVIQSVPADDRKRIRCSSGGEVGSQFSVSTSDAGSFLDCAAPLVDTSGRWCGVGDKDIPRGASPVHHTLRRKRMAKGREIKCPSIPALNMTDSAPDPRL
ncbi:unnamed protein product [Cyprideis torosa]|uniref:Uncharacterized protein n=1 Tax=Cyprideis torosa TaxID=163714 RepID=A0A7R8WQ10_9CRUS|nr:unnamed protein product [Cyprideis torosa]CAG0902437.1 unnamed protein product [Cyprideis torosa]